MKTLSLCILVFGCSIAACAMDEPCIEHAGECHSDDIKAEVDTPNQPEGDCESGWHYHWTTWPATAFYPGGGTDCNLQNGTSVGHGAPVCMKNQPAFDCSGQGYAIVRSPGTGYPRPEYRARMEAFNGH
jgi:hypothetical protein